MEEVKFIKEKTRHIKIWLDGDVIDQFDFDFDAEVSDETIKETVYQYVYDNLEVEVN